MARSPSYPLTLGGVSLAAGDAPASLNLRSGTVDGTPFKGADGSNVFQDTGLTPTPIPLAGFLEHNGRGGTPLDKMNALARLYQTRQRVPLHWNGYTVTVLITTFDAKVLSTQRVQYSLQCFVETLGALSGAPTTAPAADRTRRTLNRINDTAAKAGGASASALLALQQARHGLYHR